MDTINSLHQNKLLNRRYCLDELIATTADSQVFLARDLVEHRKCVIKRLNLFDSAKLKSTKESMFRQEAEILKKLSGKHELICQFYDYFNHAGTWYIALEWIDGITLKQLRSQIELSESEIEAILLNLLSVLECIHSFGIVHRDIKPNNIILRWQDNLPVLIDFGVAQYCDDRYESTIVGTPGYMSLEQARGKTAYSNDLYSLGLTAIYLLTGESPQTIDLENYAPASKSNLNAAIERAIAFNPQRRFTSAAQMRSALRSRKSSFANAGKSALKAWIFLIVVSLQIVGAGFGWRYLNSELDELPIDLIDFFSEESLLPTQELLDTEDPVDIKQQQLIKDLQKIIFVPGTKDREVTQVLGEPVWRKPGFWANSMAWSYENMVLEGIDLGYIFDTQTNELRQVEIAVPPSTDLNMVRAALSEFLAAPVNDNLERELKAVYQRQKSSHNFVAGDLEGIIQRNDKDRIYIAVWSADFH